MRIEEDHRNTYVLRVILAILGTLIFAFTLIAVKAGFAPLIDDPVGAAVRSLRMPSTEGVFIILTHMGDWESIVALGAAILILDLIFWRKLNVLIGIVLCFADLGIYALIKGIVMRPRPDESLWIAFAQGFSFPSGHTMNAVFCYGMMIYLVNRNIKSGFARFLLSILLTAIICTIGFSRVFVGVHYTTDVMGGASLGFAILMIATIILDEITYRTAPKKRPEEEEILPQAQDSFTEDHQS